MEIIVAGWLAALVSNGIYFKGEVERFIFMKLRDLSKLDFEIRRVH